MSDDENVLFTCDICSGKKRSTEVRITPVYENGISIAAWVECFDCKKKLDPIVDQLIRPTND